MEITVIGAGNVGGTLGRRWAEKGHRVAFGVRDPADAKAIEAVRAAGPNARAVALAGCAQGAEIVVLTIPWDAAESALKAAGNLAGKVVIDVTNPVGLGVEGLRKGLVLGHSTSGGERVAAWAPGAAVVKCFNTIGAGTMADPSFPGGPATVFLCGDDPAAKATVARLAEELGLVAADAGGIEAARLIEPLAMLWIHLAWQMGWGAAFTFQVARRDR